MILAFATLLIPLCHHELDAMTLGGRVIAHFSTDAKGELPKLPDFLLFSHWSANFVGIAFAPALDLRGARLTGTFLASKLAKVLLQHGLLSGIFSNCDLREAKLCHARLSGVFYSVDLRNALLTEAILEGANFICCELDLTDLCDNQLSQASRLRGSRLPNGDLYDGRFALPGDTEDMRNAGVDLNNSEAVRNFCSSRETITFVQGR